MVSSYGLVGVYEVQRATYTHVLVSLELNIHQLILSDLAANIGESRDDATTPEYLAAIDHVTSKIATRDVSLDEGGVHENGDAASGLEGHGKEQRVFMVSAVRYIVWINSSSTYSQIREFTATLALRNLLSTYRMHMLKRLCPSLWIFFATFPTLTSIGSLPGTVRNLCLMSFRKTN